MDTVNGALGPLYTTEDIAGTPVNSLVDPGSSATILSFELLHNLNQRSDPPRSTAEVTTTWDYSRKPILIFAQVKLEFGHQGSRITAPAYLRSDQGPTGDR